MVQHSFKLIFIQSYARMFVTTIYLNYKHTCAFAVEDVCRGKLPNLSENLQI